MPSASLPAFVIRNAYDLVFKRDAFRVVLLEPFFGGVLARKPCRQLACLCGQEQAWTLPGVAQGLDAVSYQMQELLPLYAFHLTTFHIDENESRHLVCRLLLEKKKQDREQTPIQMDIVALAVVQTTTQCAILVVSRTYHTMSYTILY